MISERSGAVASISLLSGWFFLPGLNFDTSESPWIFDALHCNSNTPGGLDQIRPGGQFFSKLTQAGITCLQA